MAATAMGVVPQKRSSSGREMPPKASSNEPSPFLPSFEQFRVELDEHYDRRERVIKSSRGITAASKKMYSPHLIFPQFYERANSIKDFCSPKVRRMLSFE